MSKWIAEFDLEDGDKMPEHMDLNYMGVRLDFHCRPMWIPVTERLPETNDDVLATDGVDMFVAWYARNSMWQGWMSSDNNFERNTPIDAWMPLPKPYKAESEFEE